MIKNKRTRTLLQIPEETLVLRLSKPIQSYTQDALQELLQEATTTLEAKDKQVQELDRTCGEFMDIIQRLERRLNADN